MSTIAELKQLLDDLGVGYPSKAKKDQLQSLLLSAKKSHNNKEDSTKKQTLEDKEEEEEQEQEDSGKMKKKKPKTDEPASHWLNPIFDGLGDEWRQALMPLLKDQPQVETFLGASRAQDIVPVREMTLQALKANPPLGWKLVCFGQQPYPRLESATGVAMFDNSFMDWEDSRFGKVVSMRCLIKAAAMHKFKVSKDAKTEDLRKLIKKHGIVSPPGWFASLLSQGVLLLNAALTVSTDDGISLTQHTKFWAPIMERIVQCLLESRSKSKEGIVFAWWGSKADALRRMVERVCAQYPGVPVRHCVHANPAAQGDLFCQGNVFGDLNAALSELKLKPIDWLPIAGSESTQHTKMSKFIADTSEMHRAFTERLGGVKDELQKQLPPILLHAQKVVAFDIAMEPLHDVVDRLENVIFEAQEFAEGDPVAGLTRDETACIHAYTQAGEFFRLLNASLRASDRTRIEPFLPFLKLFLKSLDSLQRVSSGTRIPLLYRGVAADLRTMYRQGSTVVWWGVSSCTGDKDVAEAFVGLQGERCLFHVRSTSAVSVDQCSAIPDEAEWIIGPGASFTVKKMHTNAQRLTVIELEEIANAKRLVY